MSARTTSDRFLLGIVIAVLLLAIIAFVVVLRRPQPQPLPDGSPEAAVHNYLLALQTADYETAYSYLSPSIAYPGTVDEFYDSLRNEPWSFGLTDDYSLVIDDTRPISEDSVAVTVRQIYHNNGLFGGSGYDETFSMRAERDGAAWKLVSGDRFWSSCWGATNQCESDFLPRP